VLSAKNSESWNLLCQFLITSGMIPDGMNEELRIRNRCESKVTYA